VNRHQKKEPGLIYTIQRHLASRLHYDLRLEEDGVLKSWAMPKEPPLSSTNKRLAVQVEDHPLGYETFQGTIPEGEYGAGRVEIWDSGFYQPLYRDQNIREILIQGKKIEGVYTLVRIKDRRRGKENLWLFFKNKNQGKAGSKNEKNSKRKTGQKK